MSSRKEDETDKEPVYKAAVEEDYAMKEKMTIPRFTNKVHKDSGWRNRTDTR